jgi:hypothetical protein
MFLKFITMGDQKHYENAMYCILFAPSINNNEILYVKKLGYFLSQTTRGDERYFTRPIDLLDTYHF